MILIFCENISLLAQMSTDMQSLCQRMEQDTTFSYENLCEYSKNYLLLFSSASSDELQLRAHELIVNYENKVKDAINNKITKLELQLLIYDIECDAALSYDKLNNYTERYLELSQRNLCSNKKVLLFKASNLLDNYTKRLESVKM